MIRSALRSMQSTVAPLVLALIVGACGGGPQQGAASPEPTDEGSPASPSPTQEEITFSESDLKDLVLQEQEVPQGFELSSEPGFQEVNDLPLFPSASSEVESVYGHTFANEDGSQYVSSFAYLFRDASSASAALASLEDSIPSVIEDLGARSGSPISPPQGLGERGHRIRS